MFSDKPTPGYQYKVVRNDRLNDIETAAYGSVKGLIEYANTFLSTRQTSLEGRPIIYAGDVLTIPEIPELKEITEKSKIDKPKDQLTLVIENKEIIVNSARVIKTMDTAAHAWAASVAWIPYQDEELDSLFKPFSYPKAQIYIGNELLITGALYTVSPSRSLSGYVVNLDGYSYAADIIDSVVTAPYEVNDTTLQDRANKLLQNAGIRAIFEYDGGGAFKRITADKNDKIFDHLLSLAKQRGLLITTSSDGNLLFTKAKTNTESVGTIEFGKHFVSMEGSFDGRTMYNSITAYGESPENPTKMATIIDSSIPKSRAFAFDADETTSGDIEAAAKWERSRIYAESLTIAIPVIGWFAPNGELWRENTIVSVISPGLFTKNGFNFLIKQVEFILENNGKTAILSLIPPSIYTGEEIILPWSNT